MKIKTNKRFTPPGKNWEELYKRTLSDLTRLEAERSQELARVELRTKVKLLQEFLPIVDDLERAASDSHKKDGEQIVSMLHEKMANVLKLIGVSKIATAKGELVNPQTMEIISTVEGEKDGLIIEVISQGYMLDNLIVRPSRVIVSRRSLAK